MQSFRQLFMSVTDRQADCLPRQIIRHAPATFGQFSSAFVDQILSFLLHIKTGTIVIQGHNLTTYALHYASSTNKILFSSTKPNLGAVQRSHDAFSHILNTGSTIYGVNTGFGGSAGARTTNHEQLQVALIQMLNSASYTSTAVHTLSYMQRFSLKDLGLEDDDMNSAYMPIQWVRAAMLVRTNTLIRGHSGVTKDVVSAILELLDAGITPVVPMRGSISASGDLSPLSFVASAIQGNPSTMVYDHADLANVQIVPADKALERIKLCPLVYQAKEALALVNGTAFADAVGGLAVNDAMLLAALSQMLTAMGVEAMRGNVESFDPFIAKVKGDDQQAEIARNIRGFLAGSKLATGLDVSKVCHQDVEDITIQGTIIDRGQKLAQDRYALRTSSQWLSPPTQDVLSAFKQLQQCINSTTDNPIVDTEDMLNPRILNGGNFQGSATAGAMDKTRAALQLIGKLMFAQGTEVINPATNNALPANLAATDPSTDFCCKGLDINIAAYCSELGWLAHPIGPHVQSAEMHNQAVNSLALISARKTSEAISILRKLMASNLYILCQALDVRVMQESFFVTAKASLNALARELHLKDELVTQLWIAVKSSWEQSGTFDLVDRVEKAVTAASPLLLSGLMWHGSRGIQRSTAPPRDSYHLTVDCIQKWQQLAKSSLTDQYNITRTTHFSEYAGKTSELLGKHTAAMYTFVRNTLGIPMFQGLADNPTAENGKNSIGGYVGVIERAIKRREFMEVLGKAVRDVAGIAVAFPDEERQASMDSGVL